MAIRVRLPLRGNPSCQDVSVEGQNYALLRIQDSRESPPQCQFLLVKLGSGGLRTVNLDSINWDIVGADGAADLVHADESARNSQEESGEPTGPQRLQRFRDVKLRPLLGHVIAGQNTCPPVASYSGSRSAVDAGLVTSLRALSKARKSIQDRTIECDSPAAEEHSSARYILAGSRWNIWSVLFEFDWK